MKCNDEQQKEKITTTIREKGEEIEIREREASHGNTIRLFIKVFILLEVSCCQVMMEKSGIILRKTLAEEIENFINWDLIEAM